MKESNDLMDSLLREHVKMKQGAIDDVEFIEQLEQRIDLDERGNVIPLAVQKQAKNMPKRIYGMGVAVAACVALTFLGYKHWGPQHGNIVLSSDATADQLKNGAVKTKNRAASPSEHRSAKRDMGSAFAMEPPTGDDPNPAPQMMSADLAVPEGEMDAKSKKLHSKSHLAKGAQARISVMTGENKFVSSFHKETRLSRFALNADNVSYPLVKRLVHSGRPVPADVVWIEEMVNAFDYDYPKPSGNHPFAITLDAVDCPWNLNHKLIRVAIQGKSIPDKSAEIAQGAEVQVEFNPEKVKRYRLIGYDKAPVSNKQKRFIESETIRSGHTVTAFYEVVLGKAAEAESMNSLRYEKKDNRNTGITSVPTEFANELMFVKLAYKRPKLNENDHRSYVSASLDTLKTWNKADADFKFASAVALFGMELRNSKFKEMGSLEMVEKLAIQGKGDDEKGQREEFIQLVKKLKDRK